MNQESNSISLFDSTTDTIAKLKEITVGTEPRSVSVTASGDKAYVANGGSGTVSVVSLNTGRIMSTISVGAEPVAVVLSPNGTRLYVANEVSNTVSVIDTATDAVTKTIDVSAAGGHPRAIAITNNGDAADNDERIFVTMFFGQLRPGKTGLDEGQDDSKEGRVAVIPAATNTVTSVIALAPMANTGFNSNGSTLPFVGTNGGVTATGTAAPAPANPAPATPSFVTGAYPNQLAGISIHPQSGRAYVVSTGASPNGPVNFNVNMHGLVSVFDTQTYTELTSPLGTGASGVIQEAPLNLNRGVGTAANRPVLFNSNPVAIAWSPDGSAAWIAVQQSDLLVRMTTNSDGVPTIGAPATADGSSITRVDLQNPGTTFLPGKAPQGVAINSRSDRAYVYSFVTRSISVVNISGSAPSVTGTARASSLPVPGSAEETVQLGAELFFTGRGPQGRMSNASWGACIACHPDGRSDQVTWMFDGGPRQAIGLEGMFARWSPTNQRVLNWSATRDENPDFELNTRGTSGGRGLIDDDRLIMIAGGLAGDGSDSPNIVQFQQALNSVNTTNTYVANTPALPALLSARRDFASATLPDGRVYFIGGRAGSGNSAQLVTAANAILEFDPSTNILRARSATGFTLRHSLGAACVNTLAGPRIYALGGYTALTGDTPPTNLVEEYDPATDTWRSGSAIAALPVPLAQFGTALASALNAAHERDFIHVLGGNTGSENTPAAVGSVFRFTADPKGPGSWTDFSAAASLSPRRLLGAASLLRGVTPHVFAVGGVDATNTVVATVEAYSTGNTTVTRVATPLTPLPTPLAAFGVGVSNNRLFAVGGASDAALATPVGGILEYNPAANPAAPGVAGAPGVPSGTWTPRGQISPARSRLAATLTRAVANLEPTGNTFRDPRQDAITEWIKFKVRSYAAPNRGSTQAAVQSGRAIFTDRSLTGTGQSCADCHGGPKWTRSQLSYQAPPSTSLNFGLEQVVGAELRITGVQPAAYPGVLVNTGTFVSTRLNEVRPNPADASVRVAALGANGFNIPSLFSAHSSAPYFHNGIAPTLVSVLDGSFDSGGASVHNVPAAKRQDLIEFLRSIDDLAPIIP